jgi:transcriptional regulator with XRE-family HTH domain
VVERCGCEACKAAKAAYNRRRSQAITRPDEVWLPYVSAEPARRHLAALSAAGVGLKTVARLSGVSHGALSKIVYGEPGRGRPPSRRVRPRTLEAILAIRVDDAGGKQRVDAARTWELIQELTVAGYTRGELARALGSRATVPTLQIGRQSVLASTARAVERLHRALMRRPPGGRG